MISWTSCFWALAGVIVGGTHSFALKHTISKFDEWGALFGLLRITLIGGILTAAAILGYLFIAFAGWATGFVMTLLILGVRMK
jgi:hypothetical protein